MLRLRTCRRHLPIGLTFSVVAAAIALPALADDESAPAPTDGTTYELRYKLKAGDVLRYEASHRASIRSTIDQTTQAAQTRTDSVKLWKITDVLPNGEIEIVNVVDSVHMVNQLPDHDPTEYDSQRDKTPPPGFEDVARAVGVPLSVVRMTPTGKLVRRDIKLQQQKSEEDGPLAVRLPDQAVAIGATWDEPFDVTIALEKGGTKAVQTRRHHKLTAVENGIATIEVKYQILSPTDAFAEAQLVQRLMEGEVKFDITMGRVLSQQMDIDKRILGFAGPTSSMHYIMRMEEKLGQTKPEVATQEPASAKPGAKGAKPDSSNRNSDRAPVRPRSASNSKRARR